MKDELSESINDIQAFQAHYIKNDHLMLIYNVKRKYFKSSNHVQVMVI